MKLGKTIKNQMPKTRKGKIFGIIFGVVVPIVGGIAAGVIINRFFLGKEGNYDNINEQDIVANEETITAKYNACNVNGSKYEDNMKPFEMVNMGYYLYSKHEYARSWTKGHVHASIVDQSIRGTTIKMGNTYLEESLSKSSQVDVAIRTYLKEDTTIDFYRGSATSEITAIWNETIIPYTSEEYSEDFGKTPATPLIYIVSGKTVLANSTTIEKKPDGYTIALSLSPREGVVRYAHQMKATSDLGGYPAFDYVNLKFTLDNTLLIKKLEIVESYYSKLKNGIGSPCTGYLTIDYEVDGNYHIPSLNEAITYPEV